MGKQINKYKKVYLDSCIYIYHFEDNFKYSQKTKAIFRALSKSKIVSSPIILSEILRHNSLQKNSILLDQIRKVYLELPNRISKDIDDLCGELSAKLSWTYHLRLPDSLHLSTAIINNCDLFITNDKKLKKVKEIRVILIDEL